MNTRMKRLIGLLVLVPMLGVTVPGCDSFVDVRSPMELEADEVDPVSDGEMFSYSAMQNWLVGYGNLILYDAWFTGTLWVGDTFPTRNEFGRRIVAPTNGTHTTANWTNPQRGIASAEAAIRALSETPGVPLARAQLVSGYGALLMAEMFCEGTVAPSEREPGPRMSTSELLDHAIGRLTDARSTAGSDGSDQAQRIAMAATVGIARAHLFAENHAQAAEFAAQVPDDFLFEFAHVDDPAERTRLGNRLWQFSVSRLSGVVPPVFREMADAGDPRISYEDAERDAQDGVLHFYHQMKYPGWSAPTPLASGLEARYIEVEARGDLPQMVAFINERREVGNQPPFDSADPDEVLVEFLDQRTRDFWLEGKRMGDLRRHPDHLPYVLGADDEYYKPAVGSMSGQVCWPVPQQEIDRNPNWS